MEARMSKYFSLQRFLRLFIKHTAEHYRTYIMSTAVLVGVLFFGGGFIFVLMPQPPDTGFQNACFVMLMLLSGTIFTSTIFSDFGEKNKAAAAIILPATALEKFLTGWLYSYLIFMLTYTAVFFIALYGLSSLRSWGDRTFIISGLGKEVVVTAFILYSFLHAIALLGAIGFKRLHFIKTAFLFFLAYAIMTLFNYLFLHQIAGAKLVHFDIPFEGLSVAVDGNYYVIESPTPQAAIILVSTLVSLLLWTSAYYKLKEQQV
jgi:hypothetical protein